MSAEAVEGSLPGIQDKILDDLGARIQNGSHIPGFIIDSVTRMHPLDVANMVDGELMTFVDIDEDALESMEPYQAWRAVNHITAPTVAPYKDPIDLFYKPKLHPDLAKSISSFDAISLLVGQRQGLEANAVYTGPIISEELLRGDEDVISVEDAASGMLIYHSYTAPNQTLLQTKLLDTTRAHPPESATEATGFSPDVIVCIPVANGQERGNLPHTLRLLAEQSLDHEKYEIVLLHNTNLAKEAYASREADEEAGWADPSMLIEIIAEQTWLYGVYQELLHDFPNLKIRADYAIHAPYASIGYCRMQLGDSVAENYLVRGSTNNPLLLSMDADVSSLNADYLSNMLATTRRTGAPVIASRIKWQPVEGAKVGPNTAKLMRLGTFMSAAACSFWKTPNFTDSGTAIRMKEYCLAGGHYWPQSFAENIHIAQQLSAIRQSNSHSPAIEISHGSTFGSDPRRQIDVMARGHAPTKAWKRGITTFGESDDQVRLQLPPHEQAEVVATTELERLIKEIAEDSFGDFEDEAFVAKAEVVRKGLAIIGLPDCL